MAATLPEFPKNPQQCGTSVAHCQASISLSPDSVPSPERPWVPTFPDAFCGYVYGRVSHSLPVITYYGETLDPRVVLQSAERMRHKPLNWEHRMKANSGSAHGRDRILGCVVDVAPVSPVAEDQPLPVVSPRVNDSQQAAHLQFAAVIWKHADKVPQILGRHLSGQQPYTVSMEVTYFVRESGFLVLPSNSSDALLTAFRSATPNAWQQAGLVYVPATDAPADLLATRHIVRHDQDVWEMSVDHMRDERPGGGWYGRWRGHEAYWVMGGAHTSKSSGVFYGGLAIVDYGAEPSAAITRMEASRNRRPEEPDFEGLQRFLEALNTR